jgi:hypothetical protein
MEHLFEQSQRWFREEADFWQARLTKAAERAVSEGERLVEENFEAARHGLALAEKQYQAWRSLFEAAKS